MGPAMPPVTAFMIISPLRGRHQSAGPAVPRLAAELLAGERRVSGCWRSPAVSPWPKCGAFPWTTLPLVCSPV